MVNPNGRPRKRANLAGRPRNVSLVNNQTNSDRGNVSDPITIQIQIPENDANTTQEENKVSDFIKIVS